jgi:DNA-binding response OmpR family regulator
VCILLVEDEPLIRLILADELQREGFHVVEARDGDAAVEVIAASATPITMLITDIHMPGSLDGVAVGARMRAHNPKVPIIYTTGRPDMLERIRPLREWDAFLGKPFTPSNLVTIIRRLLGRA